MENSSNSAANWRQIAALLQKERDPLRIALLSEELVRALAEELESEPDREPTAS